MEKWNFPLLPEGSDCVGHVDPERPHPGLPTHASAEASAPGAGKEAGTTFHFFFLFNSVVSSARGSSQPRAGVNSLLTFPLCCEPTETLFHLHVT